MWASLAGLLMAPAAAGVSSAHAERVPTVRAKHHLVAPQICRLGGRLVYEVETANAKNPNQPYREIKIYASGGFSVLENGQRRTGCLKNGQMSTFRETLVEADFSPPPPPAFQCKALPHTRVTVKDYVNRRRASYASPCGRPANRDVYALIKRTERYIDQQANQPKQPPVYKPQPPHPKPSPPVAKPLPPSPQCLTNGQPIYRQQTWFNSGHQPRRQADRSIVVYASGAWRITDSNGAVRVGCLSSRDRRVIARRSNRARMKLQAVDGIRCRALAAEHHVISTKHGRVAWAGPCGPETPHKSVTKLENLVSKILNS